eukprot:g1957.t1
MGVPAFFRWLMLKYPKVIVEVLEEKPIRVQGGIEIPVDCTKPNPNKIEFDNLYLDMNGIVHNCSHGEDLPVRPDTEEEMFQLIFKYIDRLMAVARPRRLLYMAIDGCAPRAKMNQQRSRRFKAAEEREELAMIEERVRQNIMATGRKPPPKKKPSWDHNVITPGTPFMMKLAKHLRYYVHDRQTHSDHWRNIRVILSDGSVPGEGEHKIMDYIRGQRATPGYDPNQKHILHGLDADLIMLGLATHEVDFTIFREQVFAKRGKEETKVADNALFDKPLQFLRIPVLREYLKAEFAGLGHAMTEAGLVYDFERVCDDFVFLCFFVGNDFLPHLPSLDIREGGIAILINIYKRLLPSIGGYLTKAGHINLKNVDVMLAAVAETEEIVFQRRRAKEAIAERQKRRKKNQVCRDHLAGRCRRGRRCGFKHIERPKVAGGGGRVHHPGNGRGTAEANRNAAEALKRSMGTSGGGAASASSSSSSTSSTAASSSTTIRKKGETIDLDDVDVVSAEAYKETLDGEIYDNNRDDSVTDDVRFGEDGWKRRYYEQKFPERAKTDLKGLQREMMQSYVEGLQWVLRYYYEGCVSWAWFYPFHYAPCASDLRNVETVKIEFDELSKPFKPVDQLMGVQPAAGAHMLPKACRPLMANKDSPIIDFYPKKFVQDSNGKPYKWLWIALLPFIDEERLKSAIRDVEGDFNEEEKERNRPGHDLLFVHFQSTEAEMLKRENVVVDFDSATGVEVEGSVGASKVDESAGGGPKHRLQIERLDPSKGFSVAGSVAPTNHFVARQATIASPSTLTFFPPMSTNMSLVVRFQDPPKRPHLCSLLPGGVEAEPVLTGQDCGNISEPRLGRGMRFDDLGRMRVTPQMLQDEKMKSRSVVSGGFGVAPGGGGTHNFRISNSWGSMEPTRKRRRQYPNGGEAATVSAWLSPAKGNDVPRGPRISPRLSSCASVVFRRRSSAGSDKCRAHV